MLGFLILIYPRIGMDSVSQLSVIKSVSQGVYKGRPWGRMDTLGINCTCVHTVHGVHGVHGVHCVHTEHNVHNVQFELFS